MEIIDLSTCSLKRKRHKYCMVSPIRETQILTKEQKMQGEKAFPNEELTHRGKGEHGSERERNVHVLALHTEEKHRVLQTCTKDKRMIESKRM